MNCTEFESTLRERDADLPDQAASHAAGCRSCASLLEDWATIATEARAALASRPADDRLREHVMKSVIEALENERSRKRRHTLFYAIAATLLITIGLSGFWLHVRSQTDPSDQWFVRNQALEDVERAEAAYRESIDRLAATVEEREIDETSPRLAALQEKLLLLDQAIAECEELAEDNPYHAGLRRQLLAVYQQKDETLREVLEATR